MDRKECVDDKWLIHLIVGNASGRTIEKVTFTSAARYPGRNSDLVRFHSYGDDHIITPKEGWGMCWAIPELSENVDDPRELDWSIPSKAIIFKWLNTNANLDLCATCSRISARRRHEFRIRS